MPIHTLSGLLAWAWTIILALTCLLPGSFFEPFGLDQLLSYDTLLHLICFAVLSLFWLQYLNEAAKSDFKHQLAVFFAAVSYGFLIEVIQSLLNNGRHFEWADLLADTMGATLGVIFSRRYSAFYSYIQKYLPFVN